MSHLRKSIKKELMEVRETLDRVISYPAIMREEKGAQQHKVAFEELVLIESRIAGIKKLLELEIADFDSP